MDPLRWQRLRPLLDRALDLEGSARADFLDSLRREQPELHEELVRLVSHQEASQGGIGRGAMAIAADGLVAADGTDGGATTDWDRRQIGRRVGAFRLESLLGAGGMGTVYLGVRVEGGFEQRVAIKLLLSAHPGLRERFRNEQEILAALKHPNIAQLIDGGETDDGLPYLAMEYVDGVSLTAFCRDRRLTLAERLSMAIKVAAALAHAHRNLVIHRDIKPSNILVDRVEGRPKLLDFGIAKLIGDGSGKRLTLNRIGPMTPSYAAPEQFRGAAVTVATDVYQFGVLLYQLISGRLPFDSDTEDPMALARAVLEDEPSTLSRALAEANRAAAARERAGGGVRSAELSRDLDAIVRHCLAKEPAERYGSMDALIADLEAFLDGRAVAARHGGRAYQMARFVQRHRLVVGVSAVAVVALLGVTAYATAQARQARADAERLRVSVQLMNSVFNAADLSSGQGGKRSLEDLLDAAAKDLGVHLDQHPELRGPTSLQIANAYAGMALPARALPLYRQAIDDLRAQATDSSQLAQALERGAFAALNNGEFAQAKTWSSEALQLARGADEASAIVRDGLYHTRWTLLRSGGESSACLAIAEDAIRNAEAQRGRVHDELLHRALARRGASETDLGRYADAERDLRRSVALANALYGPDHARTLKVTMTLGWHLTSAGKPEQGLAVLEPVGEKIREVLGERSQEWGVNLWDRANAYAALDGQWERALQAYKDAAEVYRVSSGGNSGGVGGALSNVAGLLKSHGRCAEAIPVYLEVQRVWEPILERNAPNYNTLYTSTAECALALGDLDMARAQIAKAEALFAQGDWPPDSRAALLAARAHLALAEGEPTRAAEHLAEAVSMLGDVTEFAELRSRWTTEREQLVRRARRR